MKIPILSGIYTDNDGDIRTSYPRNLIPVPKDSGINTGYLRPAYGVEAFTGLPGIDRGGINWNGEMYRVCGTKLVKISSTGVVTILGTVGGTGAVKLEYSFDVLAINSGKKLFYWDGTTLEQVVDVDLGDVLSFIWVDGYFMTTDGTYLVVTELNDRMSVNPLKYGSSEVDPDPIKCVLKLRGEPHALNRYTTETFQNVGGSYFPFQVIRGAQIEKGCVGRRAACVLEDVIVMVGSGRNESLGVYATTSGSSQKISTREIDQILEGYTAAQQESIVVEPMVYNGHQLAYIHLPDITLVYDMAASKTLGEYVWFYLTSGLGERSKYRVRYPVFCYGKWFVGDPLSPNAGILTDSLSSHWGDDASWEFQTQIGYNESRGAIFHQLELVSLPGRSAVGVDASIWTSFSGDGMGWSQRQYVPAGINGQRNARIAWLQQGYMENIRIQKFGGTSASHMTVIRLEAQLEPLYV